MEIALPIFYVDSDGWITAFESDSKLSGYLEFNDIDGEDYRCWDARGVPLKLGWEGRGVVVSKVGTVMESGALIAALRRYAALERVGDVEGLPVEETGGAVSLWETIETRKKEKKRGRWGRWGRSAR